MSEDFKRMTRLRAGVSHTFAFRFTFIAQIAFGVAVVFYTYYKFWK